MEEAGLDQGGGSKEEATAVSGALVLSLPSGTSEDPGLALPTLRIPKLMQMTKFDSQETDKGLPSALGGGTPGSWAHGGYWLTSEAMVYPGTLLRPWHGKDPP